MQTLTGFLILGFALAANAMPSRIIGGNDAPIGKYPYQVSLRRNGRHLCGGSIINERYILTASHCLAYGLGRVIDVHVGTNFLNETGDVYQVESYKLHENYSPFTIFNDIGLIRVKKNIKFNDKVQPVPYAVSDFASEGYDVVLSGWGRTTLAHRILPIKLQEIELKVYSTESCRNSWELDGNRQICTLTQYGEGACHGDSGGPLVADGIQVGIVSFGRPCALGTPDVFTRVCEYTDWIQSNIEAY